MGYGTTVMLIVIFVNIFVFLGAFSIGNTSVLPPLINTLVSIAQGDLLSLIPSIGSYVGANGLVLGLLIAGMVALSWATGSYSPGSFGGGGVGVSHLPMLVGVFIFLSFTLIPDFNALGFPSMASGIPVAELSYGIFGILLAVGLNGMIRGE